VEDCPDRVGGVPVVVGVEPLPGACRALRVEAELGVVEQHDVGAVTAENRRELPAEQVGDLLHRGGGDQFGGEFVDLTALGCFDAAAVRQAAYELHVLGHIVDDADQSGPVSPEVGGARVQPSLVSYLVEHAKPLLVVAALVGGFQCGA